MTYNPSAAVSADLKAVQVERTTNMALSWIYQEITYDGTDVENDAAVLEHNNTNTERIEIKTSWLHMITLNFVCENTATQTQTLEWELRVSGTPVQSLDVEMTKSAIEPITRSVIAELSAWTYITTAWREGGWGTDLTLLPIIKFVVVKLKS
jgi:hypothetical protein